MCIAAGVDAWLGRSSERHGERLAGLECAMREDIERQDMEVTEFDDELCDEAIDREAGNFGPLCCCSCKG